MRQIRARMRLVDGQDVCTASDLMVSAYKVVASNPDFLGNLGMAVRAALFKGERLPVLVYLDDGNEMVVGEAFMHAETPDRLHVGVFRHYCLDAETGRWRN